MITIFSAIDKKQVEKFENGSIREKPFIDILTQSNQIKLSQIDRALNVLADGDEESPYWEVFGGEVLAGGDGEALVINTISFENEEGGSCEICDPTVYQNEEEAGMISAFLEEINETAFKKQFDTKIKKLTRWSFFNKGKKELKENADEILDVLWEEFDRLRSFYKNINAGEYVVIYTVYEEEDFEMAN